MSLFTVLIQRDGQPAREQPVRSHSVAIAFAERMRYAADTTVRVSVLRDGVEIHAVRGQRDPQPGERPAGEPDPVVALRIERSGTSYDHPQPSLECALCYAEQIRRRTDRSVRIAVVVDGVETRVVRGRHPIPARHLRDRPSPSG
jgi:hypothetical protein